MENIINSDNIQTMADVFVKASKSSRVKAMQDIAIGFSIPKKGFKSKQGGGGKLYKLTSSQLDIQKIKGLFKKINKSKGSDILVDKLKEVKDLFPEMSNSELFLCLVTSWREGHSHVFLNIEKLSHSFYDDSGLDFLGNIYLKLGLPNSITNKWKKVKSFINPETDKRVYPAKIPSRDYMIGYAAVTIYKFKMFEKHVLNILGEEEGKIALSNLNPNAILMWSAYSFLRPGGRKFEKVNKAKEFGAKSAVGYFLHISKKENKRIDLNEIVTNKYLHRYGAIRNAKARTVEAIYINTLFMLINTGSSFVEWVEDIIN